MKPTTPEWLEMYFAVATKAYLAALAELKRELMESPTPCRRTSVPLLIEEAVCAATPPPASFL